MLVLTRRRQETILIGDDIAVTVIDVCGGSVRLGIAAPEDVAIHRLEIADRIARQRRDEGGGGR